MLEAWLTAGSALEPSEEAIDEPQDHPATSGQAGVHLYPPVVASPGAAPSGEYRAPVRVEGQGAGIGLDRNGDPYAGPGPRSLGRVMTGREDFKTLVADVSMGQVGAVFALEVSRL